MDKQSHCVFIQVAGRTTFHPFILEMQHVPQRAERARAGKPGVDEAPAPSQRDTPLSPKSLASNDFLQICKGSDFNCISFFDSISSHGSLKKKGEEGEARGGKRGLERGGNPGGPPSCGALQWGEEAPVHSFKGMW